LELNPTNSSRKVAEMPSTNGHGSKGDAERVALYLRVSSEEQRDAGTIQTQRAEQDGYCERNGFEVVRAYPDDGVSGTIPLHERPEGRRLLEDAKAGEFDTVVVYKLDRLARTQLGLLDAADRLERAGVALRSATEHYETATPQGRLLFQMLGSFAEFERSTIKERTRDGLYRAHRDGRHLAPLPFGYRANDSGRLEIVPEEAEVVRQIITNVATGSTLYAEAARLNALGVRPPSSKYAPGKKRYVARRWSAPTLRLIVRQGAYSGERTVRLSTGEVVAQTVPRIVDSGLQQRALARLEENRRYSGGRKHRNYLLRSLVYCAECGSTCVGRNHPRHGRPYYYYRCGDDHPERGHRAPRGHAPYVRAEWLEGLVWSDVRRFLESPGEVLERVRADGESGTAAAELEARSGELTGRLAAKHKERGRWLHLYAQGHISDAELSTHLADLQTQIDNLKLLISSVEDDLATHQERQQLAETTEEWLRRLSRRIEEVEEDTEEAHQKRRELVKLLVERIVAGRDENGAVQVHITYRFGEPEPVDEEDVSVNGVKQASASLATSAFCSASNRASGSSRCSEVLRLSSESMSTTSSSQEVGTNAVARAYSCASWP
jgi:site-specific DNA recombinase